MIAATSIALAGLQAAETRVSIRAQNIANVLTPGYEPLTPVQTASAVGPVVRAEKTPVGRAPAAYIPPGMTPGGTMSLEEQIVDMNSAVSAHGAALAVVQVSNEMDRELFEVFT